MRLIINVGYYLKIIFLFFLFFIMGLKTSSVPNRTQAPSQALWTQLLTPGPPSTPSQSPHPTFFVVYTADVEWPNFICTRDELSDTEFILGDNNIYPPEATSALDR